MLRPIKSAQLGMRIIPLKVSIDTDAATSSVLVGGSDVSSITYNGTGDVTLALNHAFRRTPVGVAAAAETDNRAHVVNAGTDLNSIQLVHTNAAGTDTDGDVYAIIVGFDSNITESLQIRQFQAACSQTKARLMGFHVDGTGTASITSGGPDATLTDNDTGDYTLTFTKAFARAPVVVPISITSALSAAVGASAVGSCQILTTDASGTATDADFYCLVLGFDSSSETGGKQRPIMSTQRLARLLALQITETGGTPTIAIGSEIAAGAAIIDNDVGDYTVTWTDAFVRSSLFSIPVATANEGSGAYCTAAANAVGTFNVNVVNASGAASDEGCDIVVLGFDSVNET